MKQQHSFEHSELHSGKRPMTRRTFMKRMALWAAGLVLAPAAAAGYARWLEPVWLDTERIEVPHARLPQPLNGLKIAQFSDLHLGYHFAAGDLAPIVQTINSLQPDLICFTGDFVDYAIAETEAAAAAQQLAELYAPLGKFAVLGNHDYYGRQTELIVRSLAAGGFRTLRNKAMQLEHQGTAWTIAGVEDLFERKADWHTPLSGVPKEQFTLLLSHCPDLADYALKYAVDLQLSGHSHGGQVRLPLYGALFTPRFGSKYVKGLYDLGKGKLKLYVNRGIGVSTLPVRFACRPEVTLITLRKA